MKPTVKTVQTSRWASKNKPLQIFRLVEELEMEMEWREFGMEYFDVVFFKNNKALRTCQQPSRKRENESRKSGKSCHALIYTTCTFHDVVFWIFVKYPLNMYVYSSVLNLIKIKDGIKPLTKGPISMLGWERIKLTGLKYFYCILFVACSKGFKLLEISVDFYPYLLLSIFLINIYLDRVSKSTACTLDI